MKKMSKIGPTRVVQNVTMPEQPEQHRAEDVGAPDRDEEDDDVDGLGSNVGLEDQRQERRDRQPQDDHDDLPAGEEGEVRVDRVDRVGGASPTARRSRIALLPAARREDDVHVPDERPDDVVGGELARREAADLAALLARDRRPDDEVDHRLRDHPDHVEVVRDAVLDLARDRDPHLRQVAGRTSRGRGQAAGAPAVGGGSSRRSPRAVRPRDSRSGALVAAPRRRPAR